jgi:hypothetical protein
LRNAFAVSVGDLPALAVESRDHHPRSAD